MVSDSGLYERLALRRVHGGGVTMSAGVYLDRGRPTPGYLTEVLDRLIWTGWAGVGDGDPLLYVQRLSLTEAGTARYGELCERSHTKGTR